MACREAGWGEDGRRLVRSPFLLLLLAGKATFQHIFSLLDPNRKPRPSSPQAREDFQGCDVPFF